VLSKEAMKDWVAGNQPKLIVMAGAGDIDALVQPVKDLLKNK
jgi:UDP-N-acetylmuramate--alanine ligase